MMEKKEVAQKVKKTLEELEETMQRSNFKMSEIGKRLKSRRAE